MSSSAPVLDPLQQPPPMEMAAQQAYTAHSGQGSVGPVIGVLAVITILGAIAVMIGRLCSGRGIRGRGQYDFEGWVETKCASCIDGRVDPPPPRVVVEHRVSSEAVRAAAPPPEERDAEANENHQHDWASMSRDAHGESWHRDSSDRFDFDHVNLQLLSGNMERRQPPPGDTPP
ncbi:hypothetical protein DH2020_030565 [Rehmannia glutinosa]|uniref:Transmembrane protein n=1 Tax=Rehmannia glutinosa TaxID=99300 RepID=A0ABR0VKG4_REHGL